jgi:hypothetical protein
MTERNRILFMGGAGLVIVATGFLLAALDGWNWPTIAQTAAGGLCIVAAAFAGFRLASKT